MNFRDKPLKRSTMAVVLHATLLGVFTAGFASVGYLILVLLCRIVVDFLGLEEALGARSSIVVGAVASIAWGLPSVLAGYAIARVGRRAPLLSLFCASVLFLAIDSTLDLLEGGWVSALDFVKTAEPTGLIFFGGMLALPVNARSMRRFENVLEPVLMLSFELLSAGVLYAIGMWAALNTGPLAGLASIVAMMIAMAGTIAMTEPQRRNRLAVTLVVAGWVVPVSVVVFGVAIGFDVSSAALLVFFQTLAVLYGYAWLFRLYPEQFRGDHAPVWARRFVRRSVIDVPSEESLA